MDQSQALAGHGLLETIKRLSPGETQPTQQVSQLFIHALLSFLPPDGTEACRSCDNFPPEGNETCRSCDSLPPEGNEICRSYNSLLPEGSDAWRSYGEQCLQHLDSQHRMLSFKQ